MSATPQLTIAALSSDAQQADVRALHTLIAHATHADTDTIRTLWAQPQRDTIVVQSAHFDPTRIPGVIETHTTPVPVQLDWPTDTHIRATLIGNPVAAQGSHKRIALPPEYWERWLRNRIPGVNPTSIDTQRLPSGRGYKPGRIIHFQRVAYTITGTVADPTMLARHIITGIGDERAYGCGLLIVRSIA